ncbi:MAG: hypothetical protein KDA80_16355 [Planctomycetaceae bacterium]|nr:hypothetical protein [Planctomycetaceae bacterium]
MAAAKKPKPTPGGRIQVNDGVNMPEFPDLPIGGWTGTVLETTGSGSKMKVILEWDDACLAAMPAEFKEQCESQGLMYSMACLTSADVTPVDA